MGKDALLTQDADNWKSEGGLCVYAGCASDEECTTDQKQPAVCL